MVESDESGTQREPGEAGATIELEAPPVLDQQALDHAATGDDGSSVKLDDDGPGQAGDVDTEQVGNVDTGSVAGEGPAEDVGEPPGTPTGPEPPTPSGCEPAAPGMPAGTGHEPSPEPSVGAAETVTTFDEPEPTEARLHPLLVAAVLVVTGALVAVLLLAAGHVVKL